MVFTAFDGMGRVSASAQHTNGVGYNFSYSYNLAGALKTETYPSGRVVTMTTDAADRPYSLSGSLSGNGGITNITTSYVTQTSYLANGGISSLARGNNLWHFESYNNRSQLTGVAEQMNNQSGAQLFNLSANWVNPAGKNNGTLQALTIASTDNPTFAQSFGYDPLNRLTSASESGSWSQAYNYDQYGNMWMPTSSGLPAPSLGPVAPTANAYSPSGPGNNRNVNSTYDNAGNLTVFGSMNVSYDAENRQTAVGSNSYSYDGFGLRVGKTTANGTTVYVYDAFGQLAAEYGSATTTSLCKTCYLSGDHLGSLRLVTDQNGSAIARHDYAPFGQEIPAGIGQRSLAWGAGDNVSQKFTGQERDGETNLDFFQARYMSSGIGRFNSPDPGNAGADLTNPQSWNGYGYVGGQPLVYTDPSGEDFGGFLNWIGGLFGFGSETSSSGATFYATGYCYGCSDDPGLSGAGAPSHEGGGSPATGGGGPTFYGTGLYLEPVSTPSTATLNLSALAKTVVRTGNYPTLDCDGYRAVRSILPQTAKRGMEFGGFLYQNSNGRYSYSNPVAGAPTSIPDLFKVPQSLLSGIVGWFHTHPLVPGFNNDRFSGSDLLITRKEGPGYLGTASGRILKLAIDPKGFPHTTDVDSGARQVP